MVAPNSFFSSALSLTFTKDFSKPINMIAVDKSIINQDGYLFNLCILVEKQNLTIMSIWLNLTIMINRAIKN